MADYQPRRRRASTTTRVRVSADAEGRASRQDARRKRPSTVRTAAATTATAARSSGRGLARASKNAQEAKGARFAGLLASKPLRIVGIALVLVLALGVVDTTANWGRIYPGVHIGSLDVSGMTFSEAYDAVQGQYDSKLGRANVIICADEVTRQKVERGEEIQNLYESEEISYEEARENQRIWIANASSLQARLDATGMVSAALEVGREEGGILARMSAQTLGYEIEPILNFNDTAIDALAENIDWAIGRPHEDCGVVIDYGAAYVTEGFDGEEVNRSWLAQELKRLMLDDVADSMLVVQVEEAPMRISRAEAQRTADAINAAIACGATFSFNGTFWNASTYELGELIDTRMVQEGNAWKLEPYYDESAASYAILNNLQSNFTDQNVQVEFVKSDDAVMVRTNATGTMPEAGEAVRALTQATLEQVPATTPLIDVEGTQMPAAMSIQAAMDYGIITEIASFETEYTGGATARNTNIHLAADLLDNSIIKADGGEWSFNETAGECNEEKGFQGAGAIVNGETVDEIGGGICQVATTVFNAVYEAGFPVDERSNHSLYIASYPAGRDAAVSWPDLDLRWHNDTSNDVLMQTDWSDTTITVTLLGIDPGYVVESKTGDFKDGAKYQKRTQVVDTLPEGASEIKQYGEDGSMISVTRTVKNAKGEIMRRDTFESVYDARDEIILVGPGASLDFEEDADEGLEDAA